MKLSLSENIRLFRKQRKLTQEKLAEALGVTVGAVYKWESGQSQPELNLLVEMADFFDTSVDVLLGYQMKNNSLESAKDRITAYCRTLDPEALREAEKLLAKYPHSFKVVYSCASIYLVFGSADHDPSWLTRSLELFEQSRVLISQNDNPEITEATICGNMSMAYHLLGKKEKSIDLLKQNNANGIFNSQIGAMLSIFADAPEEAVPYISDALTEGISILISVIIGFVFVFRARRDWNSAVEILRWGVSLLNGITTTADPDILEKVHAELLMLMAYAQEKQGAKEASAASLREAAAIAHHFDSSPDYSAKTMRFVENLEQHLFYDVLGATASGSIDELIRLLRDEPFADRWKELVKNE
ncbi:MAG: helix-turn-helix transcriptional regulator [Firmicutes bacterium]|nr:helix-turn-helix transcriptional regulator [Bacillota bacterium]